MTKSPSYTEVLYLYEKKHEALLQKFSNLSEPTLIYEKIIELGRSIPSIDKELKSPENLVIGCQSEVFLFSEMNSDGNMFYHIGSEALITSGLAALLLAIYQGECPELTLLCPPRFPTELGLAKSLSPGRSNGLASIYSRMKQDALKALTNKNSTTNSFS